MRLALARQPEHHAQRLVRLILHEPIDHERIARLPYPFRLDPDTNDYLVHVSTVERLIAVGWVTGISAKLKPHLARYNAEAALSFRDRGAPAPGVAEAWAPYLNPKEYQSRPFQLQGMERLYRRMLEWQTGVLLGDDVGLGKTVQTIALIGRLKAEGQLRRAIITTTSAVKSQWADEIARFSVPRLRTSTADGPAHERINQLRRPADVYIVNHQMYQHAHYRAELTRITSKADLLVVDESSYIKNQHTVTHQHVYDAAQRVKWALLLNATAIENKLHEFHGQMRLCDKHTLGDLAGFQGRYVITNDQGQPVAYRHLREFRKRTALATYRRTRGMVLDQLPTLRPQMRRTMMGKAQAEHYKRMVGDAVSAGGHGAVKMSRLAKVQLAALVGPNGESAKLDDLHALFGGELAGERIVMFTRFKESAAAAARILADYKPAVITGDTNRKERNDIRRRFSSKHGVGTILIGTEAITYGLNLQSAGVVVNLDLPWNPAKLRQRVGRVNRIGQERASVLVINCVAEHPSGHPTIDDYFISKIVPKRELFRSALGDDDVDELGDEHVDPEAITKYVAAVLG